MSERRPTLRVIDPTATPEEVAAIVAALRVTLGAGAAAAPLEPEPASRWVTAARLRSRRTGGSRGQWRFSGRIGSRAGA